MLRPGATIVRRVANPHRVSPPETSVGLVVEFEGDTIWLSLKASRNGGGGTYENAAESGWTDFDQWLAADVALQKGDSQVSPVSIDDAGVLTPAEPGVDDPRPAGRPRPAGLHRRVDDRRRPSR